MGKKKKRRLYNLFAYGTLNSPAIQEWIFGMVKEGKDAVLEGFNLLSLRDNLCFIQAGEGSVTGKVYSVTAKQLERVDLYEGGFYRREKVRLTSGEEVFVYVSDKEFKVVD